MKLGDTVMKTAAILTLSAIVQMEQMASAQEFPTSPSMWYAEKQSNGVVNKFCLQVTEQLAPIVDHRTTPKKCSAFSGTLSYSTPLTGGDLVSGYFCSDNSEVGFFTLPLPSDNSMAGPNFFLGNLSLDRIKNGYTVLVGGYYVIESNDFPARYIGVRLDFNKVEKCAL
jgi:hypothetical protein